MKKTTADNWFRTIALSVMLLLCGAVTFIRYESLSNFTYKKAMLEKILENETVIIANQKLILDKAHDPGTDRHR